MACAFSETCSQNTREDTLYENVNACNYMALARTHDGQPSVNDHQHDRRETYAEIGDSGPKSHALFFRPKRDLTPPMCSFIVLHEILQFCHVVLELLTCVFFIPGIPSLQCTVVEMNADGYDSQTSPPLNTLTCRERASNTFRLCLPRPVGQYPVQLIICAW